MGSQGRTAAVMLGLATAASCGGAPPPPLPLEAAWRSCVEEAARGYVPHAHRRFVEAVQACEVLGRVRASADGGGH